MNLSHVIDFYVLDFLNFKVHQQLPFHPAVIRLQEDVTEAAEEVTHNLALAMRQYLFFAAFGEARHANRLCNYHIPEIRNGQSRNDACEHAEDYDPEQVLPLMSELFHDGDWHSAYGGDRWGHICDWALEYGKIQDGAFIDHVVDLQHNGGSVLDKREAGSHGNLFLNMSTDRLMTFLNLKARSLDLLIDMMAYDSLMEHTSAKTARLVKRYFYVILEKEPPSPWFFQPQGEWVDDPTVTFGSEHVSDLEDSDGGHQCCHCGDSVSSDDVYNSQDGDEYCYSCYHDKFATCEYCGDEVYRDDAIRAHSSDGTTYYYDATCCANKEATQCDICGEWWMKNDIVDVDCKSLCPDCLDAETSPCAVCGEIHLDENMTAHDDGLYCESCQDDFEVAEQEVVEEEVVNA